MAHMEKLLAIQTKLNAPKNQTNSFGHYKYRNVEDILAGAKPLMEATKTVLNMTEQMTVIDNKPCIISTVTLYDAETGEAIMASSFPAFVDLNKKGMDFAQSCGCSASYARKYALGGLFAIDDSKIDPTYDPDTQAPPQRQARPQGNPQAKPQAKPMGAAKAKLAQEIQNAGEDADAFARHFGFDDFTDLNEGDAKEALGNFGNVMKAFKASKEEIPF